MNVPGLPPVNLNTQFIMKPEHGASCLHASHHGLGAGISLVLAFGVQTLAQISRMIVRWVPGSPSVVVSPIVSACPSLGSA